MFSFFKKDNEEENTEISEESIDDEYDDSDEEKEITYDNKIILNENRYIITTDIINFLEQFVIWSCNRPVDESHVSKLSKKILKDNLKSVFTVATCKKDKYYIIDGQHRYFALQYLKENNEEFNTKVVVDINIVDKEEDIISLFKIVNKSKPLTPQETPSIILYKTVDEIYKEFSLAIKDTNKTIYPYITKKQLSDLLSPLIKETMKEPKVYIEHIKKINSVYSRKNINDIPNVKKSTGKYGEKAKKSMFYLGLDQKHSWVQELTNKITQSEKV